MKKLTHYDHARMETQERAGMLLCEFFTFDDEKIAAFYVPKQATDRFRFVDKSVVDFRLKRDFGISIGHYSVMNR